MNTDNKQIAITELNALDVFCNKTDILDAILSQIEKDARSLVPDISTKKGRDAIASNAYNVAKAKTAIEKEGKALADRQKEIPRLIDASRKRAKTFLENLQEEVRKPLTDFEEEERRKVMAQIAKEKAEREELERIEREERERIEAERLAEIETERAAMAAERAIIEAEKTAIEAQKAAIEQAEREEREAVLKIERLEREKLENEEREKQAVLRAVEAERDRVRIEEEREAAIEANRVKNVAHQTAIKKAAKLSLMTECELTEQQAILIVKKICAGAIENIFLNF